MSLLDKKFIMKWKNQLFTPLNTTLHNILGSTYSFKILESVFSEGIDVIDGRIFDYVGRILLYLSGNTGSDFTVCGD